MSLFKFRIRLTSCTWKRNDPLQSHLRFNVEGDQSRSWSTRDDETVTNAFLSKVAYLRRPTQLINSKLYGLEELLHMERLWSILYVR